MFTHNAHNHLLKKVMIKDTVGGVSQHMALSD